MGEKALANGQKSDKLIVKDGKLICPVCRHGVLLHDVGPETRIVALPRKCKRCGQITVVNIAAPEPASKRTSA